MKTLGCVQSHQAYTWSRVFHCAFFRPRIGSLVVSACHGDTTVPELLTRNLEYFEFPRAQLGRLPSPANWLNRPWETGERTGASYTQSLARLGERPATVSAFYQGFHTDALHATLQDLAGLR